MNLPQDGERALKLNPHAAAAYYNCGLARKALQAFTAARDDFSRALELNPQLAEAWLQRGLVRWQLNERAAAQSDFAQCIQLNPELQTVIETRLHSLP